MSNVIQLRPDSSNISALPGTSLVPMIGVPPVVIGGQGGTMTMQHPVLAEHLDHLRLAGHTDGSRYARKRAVIRVASWLAGRGVALLEAQPGDLMAWRAALTVSDQVISSYVSHIRSFYDWCIRAGHRRDNPARDLPVPRRRRRLPRPIGEDDLGDAVDAAPPRIRPWLVLAAWAGLRAREIAYLRREHILDHLDPPVLLVAETAAKGRHERVVPLADYVLAELRTYGLPRRGYVFRRFDGRRGPNAPWTVSHEANEYLHEVAGLSETLHQLRHRFGSQTYQASKDLRLVQDLLGHADPATTAGYAAYDRTGAADAVQALSTPRRLRLVT